MPWPRTIVLQSIATRCMRSCYCLQHSRVLNIISVHSMQVARFRTNHASKQGHELWIMLDRTRTLSSVHAFVTLVGCSYTLPMPVKHVASPIQMYTVNLRHKNSNIKYLELCKIKILDYTMMRQEQDARCPILFVRARVKVELLWQTALDI